MASNMEKSHVGYNFDVGNSTSVNDYDTSFDVSIFFFDNNAIRQT